MTESLLDWAQKNPHADFGMQMRTLLGAALADTLVKASLDGDSQLAASLIEKAGGNPMMAESVIATFAMILMKVEKNLDDAEKRLDALDPTLVAQFRDSVTP